MKNFFSIIMATVFTLGPIGIVSEKPDNVDGVNVPEGRLPQEIKNIHVLPFESRTPLTEGLDEVHDLGCLIVVRRAVTSQVSVSLDGEASDVDRVVTHAEEHNVLGGVDQSVSLSENCNEWFDKLTTNGQSSVRPEHCRRNVKRPIEGFGYVLIRASSGATEFTPISGAILAPTGFYRMGQEILDKRPKFG